LLVASIEPVGVGELQYAFEQLKQRLGAEGLFDASRKRPLPILPGRIGIVTSLDGAALRDVLHVLGRRNRHISVIIAPARVQGEGAAHEISRGIKRLAAFGGVDVVIVGRGGGSLEDLWAFNEEVVARAIAKCPVPVISAVGHETDVTIADFVADVRAATPSHAAEMVAAREAQIRDSLADLRHRAHRELALRVARARNHVTALRHAPQLAAVPARLRTLAQLTDEAVDALSDAVRSSVAMRQEALRMAVVAVRDGHPGQRVVAARAALASRVSALSGETQRQAGARRAELARLKGALASLDPLEVLSRGYAVVTDEGGRVVRRMADLVTGQRFTVRLADGSFRARREDG
jgi:exodeoxyribonuclease VII large subunit